MGNCDQVVIDFYTANVFMVYYMACLAFLHMVYAHTLGYSYVHVVSVYSYKK